MRDLIDECSVDLKNSGYETKEYKKLNISVSTLDIKNKRDEQKYGFERGRYEIISCNGLFLFSDDSVDNTQSILIKRFSSLLSKKKIKNTSRLLIVGLGNPEILADSLGVKVVEKIGCTAYKSNNNIYKFTPNVFINTGVSSFEMVLVLVEAFNIDAVILIDSFASSNLTRLATTFQLNDAGLTPASAVNKFGQKISKATLHVPCFSIGVPLMIYSSDINKNAKPNILLSPKDIAKNVDQLSTIIANAINKILDIKAI